MQAVDASEMTYADYLALEEKSETKHEYVNGRAYAMAGDSVRHAELSTSVVRLLGAALTGKRCAPYSSDLRVRNLTTGRSTYPDVTVICGAIERSPDDPEGVTNPRVIVEVLSDSTESHDRGDKWAHYQQIASLREYVLVSQASARIEVFSRASEGAVGWSYRDYGASQDAELPSLGVSISLDRVYADPLA